MAETLWHERKIKKLAHRDWKEIVESWQAYLPAIRSPGTPPIHLISEIPQLQIELDRVAKDNLIEIPTPLPGIREAVLHDGIFLLHKAAHVLSAAQVHVLEGMCTWSVSSSYHSALFAMKALIHFLGVSVIEYNNRTFLTDVWASAWKKKYKKQGQSKMLFINTKRVEQRHMWAFLQRMLEITTNTESVWNPALIARLIEYDFTEFARHRNQIFYKTNVWPGEDLHQCIQNSTFGVCSTGVQDASCLDSESPDFSMFLSIILISMGHAMLKEIAVTSKLLQAEVALVTDWLTDDRNRLYHEAIQSCDGRKLS